jgi:hypothetical protein
VEAQKARSEARRRFVMDKSGISIAKQASGQQGNKDPSASHDQRDEGVPERTSLIPPAPPPFAQIHLAPNVFSNGLQERWDRMAILFDSVRNHARTFSYPQPSVAALEGVLIRLYMESPLAGSPVSSQQMVVGNHGT